jgi:DNA-binding MarR family transcriptional regulator
MTNVSTVIEDSLADLFDRLRKLAFSQNPFHKGVVTMPQLTLLDWALSSPGCSMQAIADGLGLTAPTVSVGVRRLENAGLLERQLDPKDGRAIQLFLTTPGRELCQQAREFRRDKMRLLLKSLTEEDRTILVTLLDDAISAAEIESQSE